MSGWRGPRQFPVHRTMSGRGRPGPCDARAREHRRATRGPRRPEDLFRWPLHAAVPGVLPGIYEERVHELDRHRLPRPAPPDDSERLAFLHCERERVEQRAPAGQAEARGDELRGLLVRWPARFHVSVDVVFQGLRRPTRIRAASSRCPRTPARHAGTGPTNDSAPQGILASPGNAPLQARVSCRLASRPRFGSPSHGSLPPTRSPCAADAQGAWSPPACCGRRHCNDYRILRRRA